MGKSCGRSATFSRRRGRLLCSGGKPSRRGGRLVLLRWRMTLGLLRDRGVSQTSMEGEQELLHGKGKLLRSRCQRLWRTEEVLEKLLIRRDQLPRRKADPKPLSREMELPRCRGQPRRRRSSLELLCQRREGLLCKRVKFPLNRRGNRKVPHGKQELRS